MRKRLRESKEYAFYERVFSRIPEEHFAALYVAVQLGQLVSLPGIV